MTDGGVVDKLVVLLGFDVDEASRKRATDVVDGLLDGLAGIVTMANGAAAALIGLTLREVEAAAATDDLATRLGMAVEDVSGLTYAMSFGGAGAEDLELSVRRLAVAIDAAGQGSAEARKTFARMGLDWRALKAQSPREQFLAIADGLARIEDPAERAALALKVLGRGGTALLPAFENGAAGLRAMMQEGQRFGIVLSEKDAKAAAKLDDTLDRLKAAVDGLLKRLAFGLVPMLQRWADKLLAVYDANREVIGSKIDTFVENLTAALRHLEGPLGVVWGILSAWAALRVSKGIIASLEAIGPAGKAAAAGLTAVGASLWWAALIAGLALAVEDLWVALNGGDAVSSDVAEAMGVGSEFHAALSVTASLMREIRDLAYEMGRAIKREVLQPIKDTLPALAPLMDLAGSVIDGPMVKFTADVSTVAALARRLRGDLAAREPIPTYGPSIHLRNGLADRGVAPTVYGPPTPANVRGGDVNLTVNVNATSSEPAAIGDEVVRRILYGDVRDALDSVARGKR